MSNEINECDECGDELIDPAIPRVQFIHNYGINEENEGYMFLHCAMCLDEMKDQQIEESPANYARLNVASTSKGFQVWCARHDVNVDNIEIKVAELH